MPHDSRRYSVEPSPVFECVVVHSNSTASLHAPSMHGDDAKCPDTSPRPNPEQTTENFRA
jgi:hypothetical protein